MGFFQRRIQYMVLWGAWLFFVQFQTAHKPKHNQVKTSAVVYISNLSTIFQLTLVPRWHGMGTNTCIYLILLPFPHMHIHSIYFPHINYHTHGETTKNGKGLVKITQLIVVTHNSAEDELASSTADILQTFTVLDREDGTGHNHRMRT